MPFRTRTALFAIALFFLAAWTWAQQSKPAAIVGVNWQAAPSSSTPEGSVAWFFDAGQNRVMVCRSSAATPTPHCDAGDLSQQK